MPAILITILTALQRIFIAKFFLAMGTTTASYLVASAFFDYLKLQLTLHLSGLPSSLATIVSAIGVTDAISIVFAAYITSLSLKSLSKLTPGASGA